MGYCHQELGLGAFFIEQLLNSWTYHSAIFAYQSKLVSLHNDNFHNPYWQLRLYAKIKNNNNENHHSYKIRISWVLNIERRVLYMRIYRRPESVYFCDRLHLSCGIFVSYKMSWFLYILVFMLFHCIFFYFQFCSHLTKVWRKYLWKVRSSAMQDSGDGFVLRTTLITTSGSVDWNQP